MFLELFCRVLRVVKQKPYMVMEIEVGIPDEKPVAGEPRQWGADEGTRIDELEHQVNGSWNEATADRLGATETTHELCMLPCFYMIITNSAH